MENELEKLSHIFNSKIVMTPEDISAVLKGVLQIMNNFKKENQQLTEQTKTMASALLQRTIDENTKLQQDTVKLKKDTANEFSSKIKEARELLDEIRAIKTIVPEDGKDADEEKITQNVLSRIKLPEHKEIMLDDGAKIVQKINALDDKAPKIDAMHIVNLPKSIVQNIIQGAHGGGYETPIKDSNGVLLSKDASGAWRLPAGGSGSGDVVGPASSTDNALVRYNGTTGKIIQNSNVTLDDSGAMLFGENITIDGASGSIGVFGTGTFNSVVVSTATPNTLSYFNGSNSLSSLANGTGVLTNNGSGTLSWSAPTITAVGNGLVLSGTTVHFAQSSAYTLGRIPVAGIANNIVFGADFTYTVGTLKITEDSPSIYFHDNQSNADSRNFTFGVGDEAAHVTWYNDAENSALRIMDFHPDGDVTIFGGFTAGADSSITGTLSVDGDVNLTGNMEIREVPYIFPVSQGSDGSLLRNDGTGVLDWTSTLTYNGAGQLRIVESGPSLWFKDNESAAGNKNFTVGVVDEALNFTWFSDNELSALNLGSFTKDGDFRVTRNISSIRTVPYTWPTSNSAGVLTNDGSGNLSWV